LTSDGYISPPATREVVNGHAAEVLERLKMPGCGGSGQITWPCPDHDDDSPSRCRNEKKKQEEPSACTKPPHSIFKLVTHFESVECDPPKLRLAEIFGRQGLVKVRSGERQQAMDAASLLRPRAAQRDDGLARIYLAYPADVPTEPAFADQLEDKLECRW
jgi:hypothetical protein